MPTVTGGGASAITGADIVDGSISNSDISGSAAITASKVAGLIGNPGAVVSIESGTSSPYSLTTVAGQKVLVFALVDLNGSNGNVDIHLKYNGVIKMTRIVDLSAATDPLPLTLAYSEIPGAATANITVDPTLGSINSVFFVIVKVQTT